MGGTTGMSSRPEARYKAQGTGLIIGYFFKIASPVSRGTASLRSLVLPRSAARGGEHQRLRGLLEGCAGRALIARDELKLLYRLAGCTTCNQTPAVVPSRLIS